VALDLEVDGVSLFDGSEITKIRNESSKMISNVWLRLKRVFECSPTAAREGGILAPEHAFKEPSGFVPARNPVLYRRRHCRKNLLTRRSGELRSRQLVNALKSPNHATFRREPGIFRAETPPTGAPKHRYRPLFPRNPLFPASGPATGSYNGIHRESNFLAAPLPGSPGEKQ
jgi:hypothetical protein